jgi:hypothetical protein
MTRIYASSAMGCRGHCATDDGSIDYDAAMHALTGGALVDAENARAMLTAFRVMASEAQAERDAARRERDAADADFRAMAADYDAMRATAAALREERDALQARLAAVGAGAVACPDCHGGALVRSEGVPGYWFCPLCYGGHGDDVPLDGFPDDALDGDATTALASAGFGTDEDYGGTGGDV